MRLNMDSMNKEYTLTRRLKWKLLSYILPFDYKWVDKEPKPIRLSR